mmetsp:Transcript_125108/g.286664  ORF Transcript_125108/g.286664 Transcript_125108/m.286664 type:complete len:211 (+) Transcript_125108:2236-2868(+)
MTYTWHCACSSPTFLGWTSGPLASGKQWDTQPNRSATPSSPGFIISAPTFTRACRRGALRPVRCAFGCQLGIWQPVIRISTTVLPQRTLSPTAPARPCPRCGPSQQRPSARSFPAAARARTRGTPSSSLPTTAAASGTRSRSPTSSTGATSQRTWRRSCVFCPLLSTTLPTTGSTWCWTLSRPLGLPLPVSSPVTTTQRSLLQAWRIIFP